MSQKKTEFLVQQYEKMMSIYYILRTFDIHILCDPIRGFQSRGVSLTCLLTLTTTCMHVT